MPANIPFVPEQIVAFIARMNGMRQRAAQGVLLQKTQALTDVFTPMPGAENQTIGIMGISTGQANFLTLLTQMLAMHHPNTPMKALDIGTFTGGSAGAMAKGMVSGGMVITCDIATETTALHHTIASHYWEAENVTEQICLHLAPAADTLQQLLDNKEAATFSIAFIDADKIGYDTYYEKCLQLLRSGGLIILDNMLWSGRVADALCQDAATIALRQLNEKISSDQRVTSVLLGDEDGIVIVKKL